MSKKGFTFLELIIALFLVTIISSTSFLLFRLALNFWDESFNRYQLETKLLYCLDTLQHDLLFAQKITLLQQNPLQLEITNQDKNKQTNKIYYTLIKQKNYFQLLRQNKKQKRALLKHCQQFRLKMPAPNLLEFQIHLKKKPIELKLKKKIALRKNMVFSHEKLSLNYKGN